MELLKNIEKTKLGHSYSLTNKHKYFSYKPRIRYLDSKVLTISSTSRAHF